MIGTNQVEHHIHMRKRLYKNLEKIPSEDKSKHRLDIFMYVIGIINPLMVMIQVYKIWILKSVEGISISMWVWYFFSSMIWFYYGVVHKEKPLIISNFIWVIVTFLMICEYLIFR